MSARGKFRVCWGYADLLDVVVAEGAAILKLLSGEDQTLLVGRNALLVLNLALDIVDSVARLNLEGDGLAREGLHETVIVINLRLVQVVRAILEAYICTVNMSALFQHQNMNDLLTVGGPSCSTDGCRRSNSFAACVMKSSNREWIKVGLVSRQILANLAESVSSVYIPLLESRGAASQQPGQ